MTYAAPTEPTARFLDKLEGVRRSATGWMARCPCHDDRQASLAVTSGDDGRCLAHCHAGCATEAIVAAVGLTMSDLYPEPPVRPRGPRPVAQRRRIVATYDYRDANGALAFQVVRYDPKDFRQRRPDGDGWNWSLAGVERVPYRLPELLAAPADAMVYIVEGERDVDRLRELGLVATCNPGGAGKWAPAYAGRLAGRTVAILPDNDEPGRKHAEQVRASVAPVAASLRVLELPDLPDKGDVSDWLDAGGTAEQLASLAAAPMVRPRKASAARQRPTAPETPEDPWPAPPADAAYHGLAGELVHAVADHTEADPVAVLGSILATFGALAGHHKTFYQGSEQAANLFVALVGDSATSRKGTAFSLARAMFDAAVPDWSKVLVPGLGSGEGLIGHLKRHEGEEHRALVLETELGRLLGAMTREGSTLSPSLRNAWDGVPIGRVLAREESIVTWHHVACLAHVTRAELRDKLTDTDAANGFGNRFLWLAVRRSRLVPFPQSPGALVSPFVGALRRAIVAAQEPGHLSFTGAAADRWQALYAERVRRVSYGMTGALTARGEAQIARLALVYALLDQADAIDAPHLAAAEAVWDYAERSARHLFGDSTGDRLADYIRGFLRDGPATRLELRHETGQRDATRLASAIERLVELGMARVTKGPSSGRGGRRPDVVELVSLLSFVPGAGAQERAQEPTGTPVINDRKSNGANRVVFAHGPPEQTTQTSVTTDHAPETIEGRYQRSIGEGES